MNYPQLVQRAIKFEDYVIHKRKVFSNWPESKPFYDKLMIKTEDFLTKKLMEERRMR